MRIKDKVLLGAAAIDARDGFDPDERAKFMNASEADACIRKQWYMKHQPELEEEQDWGYARRGNGIEAYMVDCMKAANVDIRNAGDEQVGVYSEEHRISATPDGQIVDHENEECIGWEGKSVDPRTNRDNLPKKEHVTQLQIGMVLAQRIREELGLPYDITRGVISYTDASNWNDIIEFDVPYDPKILDRMAKRAKRVLDTRQVARLPREGKAAGGKECKSMCGFKEACGLAKEIAKGTTKSGRGNAGSKLHNAVQRQYALANQIKDLTTQKKGYEEEIKTELHARKINQISVAGKDVTLSSVAGRKTLNRKAVEKAGIDLSPFETVGAPSERLTVK